MTAAMTVAGRNLKKKENGKKMRWFTSDTHFNHANIIDLCDRPFSDVDEMNESLIERWNSVVSIDDEVFHLGDVALGKIADMPTLIQRLNGKIFLVPGNHDRCWTKRRKPRQRDIDIYIEAGFHILPDEIEIHLTDMTNVLLSHLPYTGDSQDNDRYVSERPVNRGAVILHGHTHSKSKGSDRAIHVGQDAWNFYPVSEDQVIDIISGT